MRGEFAFDDTVTIQDDLSERGEMEMHSANGATACAE